MDEEVAVQSLTLKNMIDGALCSLGCRHLLPHATPPPFVRCADAHSWTRLCPRLSSLLQQYLLSCFVCAAILEESRPAHIPTALPGAFANETLHASAHTFLQRINYKCSACKQDIRCVDPGDRRLRL